MDTEEPSGSGGNEKGIASQFPNLCSTQPINSSWMCNFVYPLPISALQPLFPSLAGRNSRWRPLSLLASSLFFPVGEECHEQPVWFRSGQVRLGWDEESLKFSPGNFTEHGDDVALDCSVLLPFILGNVAVSYLMYVVWWLLLLVFERCVDICCYIHSLPFVFITLVGCVCGWRRAREETVLCHKEGREGQRAQAQMLLIGPLRSTSSTTTTH